MATPNATDIPDDKNPSFIFSMTHNDLLLQIAAGKIDAKKLAREGMANRGLGKRGEWVGFGAAAKLWGVKPK